MEGGTSWVGWQVESRSPSWVQEDVAEQEGHVVEEVEQEVVRSFS